MVSAFPTIWKKAHNSRRQIQAVLAKGMQTGTYSLPKIMKGLYANPSNQFPTRSNGQCAGSFECHLAAAIPNCTDMHMHKHYSH